MKALMYLGPKNMVITDIKEPFPGDYDVKIGVKYVGICGSDVHGYLGTTGRRIPPMVMGHEFSGEVKEVGSKVTKFKPGDRVTVQPIIFCGECEYCKAGLINICSNRQLLGTMDLNGSFAEYVCVNENNVLKLPDGMDYQEAVMIEPFSVAYRAVQKALPLTGKTVLIAGAGTIGLLVLIIAKHFGAENVVVTDLCDDRLELAAELGANFTINPKAQDMNEVLKENGLHNSIDVCFEAVGLTPTAQQTINFVRNRGTVIWIGNSAKMIEINMQQIVTRELVVMGTYCYNQKDFNDALTLLGEGKINIRNLISKEVSLEDAKLMFDRLVEGDGTLIKVIVNMDINN